MDNLNSHNDLPKQINEVEQFNDDLFSIMDEGKIDMVMLKRLTDTTLKDMGCSEVSLWTINRNNKKVDGTPRLEKNRYLSTSLVCRSKDSRCKYEFNQKQEFTHSLKLKCLFAEVVDNVTTNEPYRYFSGENAIREGFTSKDFIEKEGINHIFVIPITENDQSNTSKEAIAIIELSYRDKIKPKDASIRKYAKSVHGICGLALRNYTDLQKQVLVNKLIEAHENVNETNSQILCDSIMNVIREILPCQGASFFLKDSLSNSYCLKASTGICDSSGKIIDNYANVRYTKGEGLTGKVGENGCIFVSDDLAKDKERPHLSKTFEVVTGDENDISDIPQSKKVKTGMFIPIVSTRNKNNVIGIVRLINKKNKCNSGFVDFFNDVDEDIMAFTSSYLSAIIESHLNAEQLYSFESRVSHEVRRPTGIILLNTKMLESILVEKEVYEGEIEKKLKMIKNQAERQKHNLQVLKILYGDGFSSCEDVKGGDFYNIINKSWEETEPLTYRNNFQTQEFENEIPKNKYLLRVNANAFIMAFSNLFENAIKYQDPAEDTSWLRITVNPWQDGSLHVIVADNGVGITTNERELVFTEGYRGRNIKDYVGAGLGLPTVRRIMEDYKGTITIKREKKPTTFEIVLPKTIVYYNNQSKSK